jgi:hypothetical protein
MPQATKEDWLDGPGDLAEDVVEDVPVKGKSVKVRALGAKFSNEAQTKATETRTDGTQAFVTVNKARLEILQFTHGVIEPKFTEEEAEKVSEKYAGAFFKVIERIDEISSIDKEAIAEAQARFPDERGETAPEAPENNGDAPATGSGGSDVPLRVGAGDGKERP